jgi:hypothetical protein
LHGAARGPLHQWPVYARALTVLVTAGIVELTAFFGYCVMVATARKANGLPLPEGVDPPLAAVRSA